MRNLFLLTLFLSASIAHSDCIATGGSRYYGYIQGTYAEGYEIFNSNNELVAYSDSYDVFSVARGLEDEYIGNIKLSVLPDSLIISPAGDPIGSLYSNTINPNLNDQDDAALDLIYLNAPKDSQCSKEQQLAFAIYALMKSIALGGTP